MSFEKFKEFHNSNYHDGDSTFDERHYKKSNGDDFDNCFVQDCYDHFEAGAKSRQAEINALQRKLKLCEALRDNQFEHLLEVKEQRDVAQRNSIELQKRIDLALNTLCKLQYSSGERIYNEVGSILKGNKSD